MRADETPAPPGRNGIGVRLLRLPLYFKLIIANSAITLLAVVACASVAVTAARANPGANPLSSVWPVIVAAVLVGIVVNAAVVHVALTPLRNLVDAAEKVRGGSETARAIESAVSDREMQRATGTFNSMLDSVGEYRRRLREIAIRAIDAGEAERKRLSRDLHDGTAQALAAVLVQLRVVRKTADPATAASLEGIADQLAGSINELRMLAQGLRPPALDMIGLSAAIQAHARNVTETGAVRVDTRIEGVDGALQPESELALYRLIQEALLNVVRHSRSDQARVEVERNSGHVVATVADEGRGFDVDDALVSGALGLFGMHERASYVGGRVTVRSAPGQGTRVRIEIPLRETTTWPTPSAS